MLRSLGIRNCFRVNDKARGTLSWNKPGEGEVRDPNGDQLLTHIIDSLNTDLIKEKSYYEEEIQKLLATDDHDLYQLEESKMFVNFCTQLLKKDPMILNKFKRELIKQGKAKGDNEPDKVYTVTYTKLITLIMLALFPNMTTWIEKSFYELGRHIGSKIKDYYHTEGASTEFLYIVIHADNNSHKQIYSKDLISYISEAIASAIDSEMTENIIFDLLLYKADDPDHVKKMIDYLRSPTLEDTTEIMKGILSL
jgi:hypothetical protein